MPSASPLQIVNARFGSKAELVDKVAAVVEPQDGESSEDHKRRLRNVANRKLLHLLALAEKVQTLGGRAGIVKRILELKGQTKDHEYSDKLKTLPLGKLVDFVASLERRAKAAKKKKI